MAEKFFTQTELNKIVAARIKRERERLSRDFEKRLKRCMESVHLTICQEIISLKNVSFSERIDGKLLTNCSEEQL